MCIIIYTPKGHIPKKHLKNSLRGNPHGWGVMWPNGDGKLNIAKGMTADEFFVAWKEIKDLKCPKVFHARISTHGTKTIDNCHPFLIPGHENLAVMHNGIIKQMEGKTDDSDTKNLANLLLADLPKGFQGNASILELLDEYIGYSKLVFMDGQGTVTFVKERSGTWMNGLWYSNGSWCNTTGYGCKSSTLGFHANGQSVPYSRVTEWDSTAQCWVAAKKPIDYDAMTEDEWVSSRTP